MSDETEDAALVEASKKVLGWAKEMEVVLSLAALDRLSRMVASGRLERSGGKFHYELLAPITLGNKETITTIEIGEPSGQTLLDADIESHSFAATCKLIGLLSGHAGVAERFGQRDLLNLTEVVGFFGA